MSDTTPLPLEPLVEQVAEWRSPDLAVDRHSRLVQNVTLSGDVSRNGHRYASEALRNAAPLYERKPVFLDHAVTPSRPYERSTRDLVGVVRNPRFEGDRIRGDIQVLDTEAGRIFLGLAEADGPAVGMSHVVLAQRNADRTLVERIHDVVSVDAVVFPATTQGFGEQTDGDAAARWAARQAELETRCEQLQQLLDQRDRAEAADRLLRAAGLPPEALSEAFCRQVRDAKDSDARQHLIRERRELIQRLTPRKLSTARRGAAANDTALVQAIRGFRPSVLTGWEG